MNAVLAVWNNVHTEHEAEFNEWYIREHIPDRVSVPGFNNGRRHLALSSADPRCPRNFTFYEVQNLAVLRSASYLECLANPTEWTQRTMPWLKNMNRTACRVVCKAGQGHGAFAGTLRLTVEPDSQTDFDDWVQRVLLPALIERPGIASAQYWRGDVAATGGSTPESELRSGYDDAVTSALMVSATHAGALVNAASLTGPEVLENVGASSDGGLALYQLVYALHQGISQ